MRATDRVYRQFVGLPAWVDPATSTLSPAATAAPRRAAVNDEREPERTVAGS